MEGKKVQYDNFVIMKDNFSRQAESYAKYRPAYPRGLFDYIISHVKQREAAWDCATGNGQSAIELSRYFEKVYATDSSQSQLDHAMKAANIFYSRQLAEQTSFADHSFDLVTVSQALHWFRFDEFYKEVRRLLRPGSWLAVWTYSLLKVSPAIDPIIEKYHFETLAAYWDPERRHVDQHYASIPFPFDEIKTPAFSIELYWSLDELEGYFHTWSVLQKFIAANHYNPVSKIIESIRPHWTGDKLKIVFPLYLRMGKAET